MNKEHYLFLVLSLLIFASSDLLAQRLAVPEYVTCDRNQLTSWQGEITKLVRVKDGVKLWVATDHGTNEVLNLTMPNWKEVLGQFRIHGRNFHSSDWEKLIDTKGKLKVGMKAIVWLCNTEGISPVINWQPPSE
ncbi:hypothetical protein ACJJI5_06335 [Microbulbifer sp. EKSA008]|uniref:hypothetical protein n=1 Tax=unclassified Microbulbifer TaxID=2619833 RepID=UPI0040424F8B